MSKKKKIIIIVASILVLLLCIGGIFVYKNIEVNKQIEEFEVYVNEVKEEMSTYIIEEQSEKYEEFVKKSERIITNKSVKDISNFKEEFNSFKEEIIKENTELINLSLSEIEGIDISKLEEKESIQLQIEEIKKMKEERKFIKAKEMSIRVNDEINNKLEALRIEEKRKVEEEEARRLEEERKNAEEAISNICGKYEFVDENELGFVMANGIITITKGEENDLILSGELHKVGGGSCTKNDHIANPIPMEHMRCVNYFSSSIDGEVNYNNNNYYKGTIENRNENDDKHNVTINVENNELIIKIETGRTAGTYKFQKVDEFTDVWSRLESLNE